MNNEWVMDIESTIFTIVKSKTYDYLKKKYPGIYFTTEDVSTDTNTKDYTVYIHNLAPIEKGNDLEGKDINAIQVTFEIQVIVNTNKTDAKKIVSVILSAFKELCFQGNSLPLISTGNAMHTAIARLGRTIGYGDSFDVYG